WPVTDFPACLLLGPLLRHKRTLSAGRLLDLMNTRPSLVHCHRNSRHPSTSADRGLRLPPLLDEPRRTRSADPPDELLIDLGLDELRQVSQRLLPAEITGLGRNGVGHAGLLDIHLGADQYFLQRHRYLHLAGQVGIVKSVGVAQALARDEFSILAAKRVAFAGRKVPEGHLERPAGLWFLVVHGAGKSVGRNPFGERIR